MRPLLFPDAALVRWAEEVQIALAWAAERAKAAGMSPTEAANRLRLMMEFDEMAQDEETRDG